MASSVSVVCRLDERRVALAGVVGAGAAFVAAARLPRVRLPGGKSR
jgi:hypothetical protein